MAWGEPCDCGDNIYPGTALRAYEVNFRRIGLSLAAWQASPEVNSFSSKRDMALQRELDGIDVDSTPGQFPLVGLTDRENYGHDLFYATFFRPVFVHGVPKFSNCGFCHSDNPFADTGAELFQQYADDGYHNIGTPYNPEIPGNPLPNVGLADLTGLPAHVGFHKTPTLRNVDKRPHRLFCKAFTHNGWFKSLESLVHFYNTAYIDGPTARSFGVTRCPENVKTERDALRRNCWPAPEYASPAIPILLGDLGLTLEDEAALVAYLKTFTDHYTPEPPKPYRR
jgi:cytochrome c peroxidase